MSAAESACALGALAGDPRWVAWRYEWRNEGDARKLTKIPFGRDCRPAKADDPSTWLTREEASDLAKSIANGLGGGIGIQLGDLGDGGYLIGFDLDSCLDEQQRLAPWAAEIIKTACTSAETSPSSEGVKLFAVVAANDVRPFLASSEYRQPTGEPGVRCPVKTVAIMGQRSKSIVDSDFLLSRTTGLACCRSTGLGLTAQLCSGWPIWPRQRGARAGARDRTEQTIPGRHARSVQDALCAARDSLMSRCVTRCVHTPIPASGNG